MMGVGRVNMTLNQTHMACKSDCVISNKWKINDGPLVSSNPNCPIVDYKIMHDDGSGKPTYEPNPMVVRIETDSTTGLANMEIDTAAVTKKLQAGDKLNYILIAITASGQHDQPG